MAHGDWRLLVLRPLSLTLLLIGALVLVAPPLMATVRRRRAAASAAKPATRWPRPAGSRLSG